MSTMIDLDDFLPEINPKAPDCPAPAAYRALRSAAREFCQRTRLWRFTDTIPVMTTDAMDLSPPDQAEVVEIESAMFGDIPLTAKPIDWLDQCMRGWRRGAIEGMPRFYSQLDMNTMRITPIENGIVTVTMFLQPSDDADQLPDFLLRQYMETIAWGALGRLLQLPGQPFTDVQMGAGYLAAFEQRIGSLQWKTETGQQQAAPRRRGQYM